jgi:hypothetical protein
VLPPQRRRAGQRPADGGVTRAKLAARGGCRANRRTRYDCNHDHADSSREYRRYSVDAMRKARKRVRRSIRRRLERGLTDFDYAGIEAVAPRRPMKDCIACGVCLLHHMTSCSCHTPSRSQCSRS